MENFILYLSKVSVLLAIFFLAYYFLLRKETFFNSNRWFLLLGIFTSLALPFFVYTKIIWVEPIVVDVSPVTVSAEDFQPATTSSENFQLDWWQILGGIYFAGVLVFAGRLVKDFRSLFKILKKQKSVKDKGFRYVDTEKVESPFSFFNYIVYNSNRFSESELQFIIEHEKIHSSQLHSMDMVISQLFCVAFWFNPFAWLHKKAIAQNLEFIADNNALKNISDKINYQKTLLKVSVPHYCIPVTNHFYQSLIKKRIFILNKNQSKKRNSWKYAIVLPLLAIFAMQFQVETVAQMKTTAIIQKKGGRDAATAIASDNLEKIDGLLIVAKTDDAELSKMATQFSNDNNVDLRIEKVKRNQNGQITEIAIVYDNKRGSKVNRQIKNSGKIIGSILISAEKLPNGSPTILITDLDEQEAAVGRAATAEEVEAIAVAESGEAVADITVRPTGAVLNNGTSYASYSHNAISSPLELSSLSNVDYEKAYILIDGKEATANHYKNLEYSNIRSSTIQTGRESLAKKYGSKALNGIIIIETGKPETIYVETSDLDSYKSDTNFNLEKNCGFVIHKKSEESDLKFYKETLAKSNIQFEYSSVKRNSAGEITGMKLRLSRKVEGNNENVNWNTKSDKPISDVFIGERGGKLVIAKQ